ncbi:MAG: hypothetical protein MJ185_08000 [Treponema sp.]|nr:hypothetical protein [Treponema sp.]
MKKIVFTALMTSLIISFSGCKLITSLFESLSKGTKHISDVVSSDSFEVTSFGNIKLSDYNISVQSDSQVFVVQVNEGERFQKSGIMKSEFLLEDDEDFITASRSAVDLENESLINVIPEAVKNSIKVPKVKDYSSKKVNYSLYGTQVGDSDDFKVISSNDLNASYDDLYGCDLVYVSDHAYVYYNYLIGEYVNDDSLSDEEVYEKGINYLNKSDFEKIGKTFDKIFDSEVALLGRNDDFDNFGGYIKPSKNSKVVILLYDIFCDSHKKNKSWTYGFFNPNDFLLEEHNPYSNEDQIIYIDSVLYKKSPETTLTTLSHEFAHLLNYCNKNMKIAGDDTSDAQTWYSEMLAMLTEDLLYNKVFKPLNFSNNTVIKNRIPDYAMGHHNGFVNWDSNVLDSYGNAFAYGSFLVRNYGGPQLVHEIATNTLFDEASINSALRKLNIKEDYYSTFSEYAKCSVNQKISENAKSVLTLNKDASWKGFVGDKIDILSYNAGGVSLTKSGSSVEIGPGGFIVQYAGKGAKKINVTKPEGKDLKVYVVVQTVE